MAKGLRKRLLSLTSIREIAAWIARSVGWGTAPSGGSSGYFRISFHGGTAVLQDTKFSIEYQCRESTPCQMWDLKAPNVLGLCLLHSESGNGKSTLLDHLYRQLRFRELDQASLRFDFTPDLARTSPIVVGYVPQHPPMVNHWPVTEILPDKPFFLGCFFEDPSLEVPFTKHVGEFSGGQRRRLYACSVLEKLARQRCDACFALFDETFDGLGPDGLSRCMRTLRTQWAQSSRVPLYVLLVTHLPLEHIRREAQDMCLALAIQNSLINKLVVSIGESV